MNSEQRHKKIMENMDFIHDHIKKQDKEITKLRATLKDAKWKFHCFASGEVTEDEMIEHSKEMEQKINSDMR